MSEQDDFRDYSNEDLRNAIKGFEEEIRSDAAVLQSQAPAFHKRGAQERLKEARRDLKDARTELERRGKKE